MHAHVILFPPLFFISYRLRLIAVYPPICPLFVSLFLLFLIPLPFPVPVLWVGKHLHMYYHKENDAWAISTELGSLDVLAYILSDVFDARATLSTLGDTVWNVSNGHGDYEVDPDIQMWGRAVPPLVTRALCGGITGMSMHASSTYCKSIFSFSHQLVWECVSAERRYRESS